MEPVELAILVIEPRRISDLGNASPLWLGKALTDGDDVRLYVKRATPEEILSECLCAVLGEALDLPIARVYLVEDPLRYLGGEILIGSLDAGMRSLRHHVQTGNPIVEHALGNWPKLQDAALFDEWIANPDRNSGNLLWDAAQEWVLIDHARALGAWPDGAPVPNAQAQVDNQLARLIYELHGDFGLMRARKRIEEFSALAAAALPQAPRCVPSQRLALSARSQIALSFLASRIHWLPALLARHGRQPELPL